MPDIDALKAALHGLAIEDNPAIVQRKSRDFCWYSPVLKRQLDEATRAHSRQELRMHPLTNKTATIGGFVAWGLGRGRLDQLAFKRKADPKGLLNRGKMIAWDNPGYDFSDQKVYLFPGLAS